MARAGSGRARVEYSNKTKGLPLVGPRSLALSRGQKLLQRVKAAYPVYPLLGAFLHIILNQDCILYL